MIAEAAMVQSLRKGDFLRELLNRVEGRVALPVRIEGSPDQDSTLEFRLTTVPKRHVDPSKLTGQPAREQQPIREDTPGAKDPGAETEPPREG